MPSARITLFIETTPHPPESSTEHVLVHSLPPVQFCLERKLNFLHEVTYTHIPNLMNSRCANRTQVIDRWTFSIKNYSYQSYLETAPWIRSNPQFDHCPKPSLKSILAGFVKFVTSSIKNIYIARARREKLSPFQLIKWPNSKPKAWYCIQLQLN